MIISDVIEKEMREAYQKGATQTELGKKYHISQRYICDLLSGKKKGNNMPRQQKDDILITTDILAAINRYLKDNNIPLYQMSLKMGFSKSSMDRWMNGKASFISRNNWNTIFPHIKHYLPSGKYNLIAKHSIITQHSPHAIIGNNFLSDSSPISNLIQQKIKSIMSNPELTSDEKVKFIQILIGD